MTLLVVLALGVGLYWAAWLVISRGDHWLVVSNVEKIQVGDVLVVGGETVKVTKVLRESGEVMVRKTWRRNG